MDAYQFNLSSKRFVAMGIAHAQAGRLVLLRTNPSFGGEVAPSLSTYNAGMLGVMLVSIAF
ncbi:MAG: hypothetical protein DME45_07740 [Verrucomicrobia bacterium]|nr:MAG: hypothetical protein DME45_07740 [Verrucomicrobiota bacterium]